MLDPIVEPVDHVLVDRDPLNGHIRLVLHDPVQRGRIDIVWITDEAAAQLRADLAPSSERTS